MRPLKPDPSKDPTLVLERELLELELPERESPERESLGSRPVSCVIGVDEAGRGALAGPVSVGAHVFYPESGDFPVGLRDSKILSEKRREAMLPLVEEWGPGAVGMASPDEITEFGITRALAIAARRALLELNKNGVPVTGAIILLDGSHDWLSGELKKPLHIETRVGADRSHAVVAAASLRAKVTRDRLLHEYALDFPGYGWERNKGYGAKEHLDAIKKLGKTRLHRESWIKL